LVGLLLGQAVARKRGKEGEKKKKKEKPRGFSFFSVLTVDHVGCCLEWRCEGVG